MAELEKVIKGLECCAGQCNYHGCPYKDPCENANGVKQIMLDAISLLKEQEPKHVGKEWNDCPCCHKVLSRIHDMNYCGACGQAVKWE